MTSRFRFGGQGTLALMGLAITCVTAFAQGPQGTQDPTLGIPEPALFKPYRGPADLGVKEPDLFKPYRGPADLGIEVPEPFGSGRQKTSAAKATKPSSSPPAKEPPLSEACKSLRAIYPDLRKGDLKGRKREDLDRAFPGLAAKLGELRLSGQELDACVGSKEYRNNQAVSVCEVIAKRFTRVSPSEISEKKGRWVASGDPEFNVFLQRVYISKKAGSHCPAMRRIIPGRNPCYTTSSAESVQSTTVRQIGSDVQEVLAQQQRQEAPPTAPLSEDPAAAAVQAPPPEAPQATVVESSSPPPPASMSPAQEATFQKTSAHLSALEADASALERLNGILSKAPENCWTSWVSSCPVRLTLEERKEVEFLSGMLSAPAQSFLKSRSLDLNSVGEKLPSERRDASLAAVQAAISYNSYSIRRTQEAQARIMDSPSTRSISLGSYPNGDSTWWEQPRQERAPAASLPAPRIAVPAPIQAPPAAPAAPRQEGESIYAQCRRAGMPEDYCRYRQAGAALGGQ